MGMRTSHEPGTFSWVDLASNDAGAAKSFYAGLFGWDMDDSDDGGGGVYTTCRLDGAAVSGIHEMPEEMRAAGAPPSWMSYVTVEDAEAAAAEAKGLEGRVANEARDLMDLGRMAVLADPQGAVFAVWQPRTRIGAERVNDIGCLCMNELATTDIEAARSFYEGLFGWATETIDTGPDGPPTAYAHNRETLNASFGLVEDGESPNWRPYFTVESVENATERVRELGGRVLVEQEIPDGRIAIALDLQGALFALFEGEVDP